MMISQAELPSIRLVSSKAPPPDPKPIISLYFHTQYTPYLLYPRQILPATFINAPKRLSSSCRFTNPPSYASISTTLSISYHYPLQTIKIVTHDPSNTLHLDLSPFIHTQRSLESAACIGLTISHFCHPLQSYAFANSRAPSPISTNPHYPLLHSQT